MRTKNELAFMSVLAAVLVFTSDASAQEARSFDQLELLIKPGDTIHVTDFRGKTTKGKVMGLSSAVLRFSAKGATRDLSESDVYRIQQWRGDSLKNGAFIGLGVGIGMGALSALFCERSDHTCQVGVFTSTAGIYTAIGVGIDALIPSKQTIYFGGTRTTSLHIEIKPILQPSQKGVAMAFSF